MSKLQDKLIELKSASYSGVKELAGERTKNYSDIFQSSLVFAGALQKYDGEIITVVIPNSIDYIELMISCFVTGNIFNPIPYFTSPNELARILEYVNPKFVVTDRDDLSDVVDKGVVISLASLQSMPGDIGSLKITPVGGDKVASLYYSSGTTGNPKGVMYSHDNIYHLIDSINRGFGFGSDTKHLTLLPFGHTASINYNLLPCLFNGSPLVIAESFSSVASQFFRILSDEQINYTQLVPTIVFMLLKIKYDCDDLDFSNLMFIGCGSSILPVEAQIKFKDLYGISIGNLYGLSETGPTHMDDPRQDDWKPGTVGVPLDVNECKLAEDSELLIKGKNVFVGYYKNKDLYEDVVKDGWFHTGDIVSCDNGVYEYRDRKKDLIIKGGINIVPGEVEEIIYRHAKVHEAVVVGIPDDIHGEEVVAAIVLKGEQGNHEDIKNELTRLVRGCLSSYKQPADYIFFTELPKTHSGKLIRRKVREMVVK